MIADPSKLSIDLDFESIVPHKGKSFRLQVQNCLDQLSSFIFPKSESGTRIARQTFFIASTSREQFEERSALIREMISSAFGLLIPATSMVSQSPEGGCQVVLEITRSGSRDGKRVVYKSWNGLPYTVIDQGGFRSIHCAGLTGDRGDSIRESSVKAFDKGIQILGKEGLSIHHIIRQWNYIEQITRFRDGNNQQNYQVFNEVRTGYYSKGNFDSGYPAATGIGMNTGGVVIDFTALSGFDGVVVRSIKNPGQIDAHRYSENVLEGGSGMKHTPKFERAKMVHTGSRHYFYVSGTASILGEKTSYAGDVAMQTRTTIENIYRLFSSENREELGVEFYPDKIVFSHLRIYVKHREDIPTVRRICESMLQSRSVLYLVSDICREELLVEIEGAFAI